MSAPKPTPDAWDWTCPGCDCIETVEAGHRPKHCTEFGCIPFAGQYVGPYAARWGERWADVARLAEGEKRQGVLYEYLLGVRTQADLHPPHPFLDELLETLPEDAMQLLAVNL